MGLSLRPENKPVHLTAGVEASNISEKYYEPPLMQVIPSACESCEENKYEVSNSVINGNSESDGLFASFTGMNIKNGLNIISGSAGLAEIKFTIWDLV